MSLTLFDSLILGVTPGGGEALRVLNPDPV